jgi:UDP-N-acetylglucosamine--N-acetylmuramyl-(pentapeptide) pyrophosphoryl-undecaprenol N-acetylglucosamine transferase
VICRKRENNMFKVFMAGGGTGGHLFPGISLAEAIKSREPDSDIRFVISGKKLDLALLEDKGFSCVRIEQRHLPQHPRQLGDFMLTNARALWQVVRLMLRDRPDVVVGLGGYASFAAATSAKLLGVPLVVLEQNVIPGRANRALALAAQSVFCQWPEAARYFVRRDNLRFTGNPTRESLKKISKEIAREKLGLAPARHTLLVLGGSQGASALNRVMLGSLGELGKLKNMIQIIHLAGKKESELVRSAYMKAGISASVYDFLKEMELAYWAADLAFCRAGGTTIAELTAVGLPSVLVPFPHAAQNHQLANAKALVTTGAARLIEEKSLSVKAVKKLVLDLLLDSEELGRMAEKALLAGRPAAASQIAANIVREFKQDRKNTFAQLLNV